MLECDTMESKSDGAFFVHHDNDSEAVQIHPQTFWVLAKFIGAIGESAIAAACRYRQKISYQSASSHKSFHFTYVYCFQRLGLYYRVIHTSAVKSMDVPISYYRWWFFNSLLIVLLCLHIFWASIIFNMAKEMIVNGTVSYFPKP